jgi:hypothetical protein
MRYDGQSVGNLYLSTITSYFPKVYSPGGEKSIIAASSLEDLLVTMGGGSASHDKTVDDGK